MSETDDPVGRIDQEEAAWAVVQEVNLIRAAANLTTLVRHPALDRAALLHARDLATFHDVSHTGRDGRGVRGRVERTGYLTKCRSFALAENIAMGYPDAAAAVQGWLDSPSHRANILGSDFIETGVAVAVDDEFSLYWVQVFGSCLT